MSTQPTPENGGPAAPNPYGAPAVPMSKKELKAQKRMQKASRGWFARHKVLTGVLVLAGIGVVGSQLGGEEDSSADAQTPASTSAPAATEPTESSAPASSEAPAEEDAPAGEAAVEEAVVDEAPAADEAAAEEPAGP